MTPSFGAVLQPEQLGLLDKEFIRGQKLTFTSQQNHFSSVKRYPTVMRPTIPMPIMTPVTALNIVILFKKARIEFFFEETASTSAIYSN